MQEHSVNEYTYKCTKNEKMVLLPNSKKGLGARDVESAFGGDIPGANPCSPPQRFGTAGFLPQNPVTSHKELSYESRLCVLNALNHII